MNGKRISAAAGNGSAAAETAVGVRTIPFDYVLTFDLKNDTGRVITRALNISPVGTFSVTAIGYGLMVDERRTPRRFGPADAADETERPPIVRVPAVVLPGQISVPEGIVEGSAAGEGGDDVSADAEPPAEEEDDDERTHAMLEGAEEGEESVVVEAEPGPRIKLLGAPGATLRGSLNGRPIRGPKGDEEIVLDAEGRAFLPVLPFLLDGQGTLVLEDLDNGSLSRPIYVLGSRALLASAPHFGLTLPRAGGSVFDVVGVPGTRARVLIERPEADRDPVFDSTIDIPEDGPEPGVARVRIADLNIGRKKADSEGKTRRQMRDELEAYKKAFRLRAGDVVTLSIPEDADLPEFAATSVRIPRTLGLSLASLPVSALRNGFRLSRPLFDRILNGSGAPVEELEEPFVPCCVDPCNLSFLYSIRDNGTGRAFQNEPVHNIAGLGIANGDRPFRTLAYPIVFEPRSVILFQVEEISGGPGTLYIVLQGYKTVGAGRPRFGFEG